MTILRQRQYADPYAAKEQTAGARVGYCPWHMLTIGTYQRYNPRRRCFTQPTFDIPDQTRLRHVHLIGTTGTGKSTLIANAAIADIRAGRGVALFDAHGDLARDVLARVPPARRGDVIYFAPRDHEYPIGFNVLDAPGDPAMIAAAVVDAFHHLFRDSWGPQLEQILSNAVLASLAIPDGSLLTTKFFLTHPDYRKANLHYLTDPVLRDFWETDFEKHLSSKERRERTLSTLNKIGQFIQDPVLRNIVSQRSAFTFPEIFEGKVLIADLSDIGQTRARLLGSLLIAQLHSSALFRKQREPFFVYVDEFQSYGSQSFIAMLSEIRKFGVSLTVAHQYSDQLSKEMQGAVLGTVGTHVAFAVGPQDAELLAPYFDLKQDDLTTVPAFKAYVRTPERTLRLNTGPLSFKSYPAGFEKIRRRNRAELAQEKQKVEDFIGHFLARLG